MNILDTYYALKEFSRCKDLTKVIWSEEDCWVVDALYGSIRELKYRGTLFDYVKENPHTVESLIDRACARLKDLKEPEWSDEYLYLLNYEIGLGTYGWKYDHGVIRAAIDAGIRFIDTAETYGYGRVETALGEVLCEFNTDALLVATKVSRSHLSYKSVINAVSRSISKLGLDKIRLYQIHWPNPKSPLRDTAGAMRHLIDSGIIDAVGICNCSVDQLIAVQNVLWPIPVASVQVRYNLMDRGIERALLPYCQSIGIPVIAYSPLGQKFSRLMGGKGGQVLTDVAHRYGISEAQVALAWLMSWEGVIPIPRTNNPEHAVEIAEMVNVHVHPVDLKLLDRTFPI